MPQNIDINLSIPELEAKEFTAEGGGATRAMGQINVPIRGRARVDKLEGSLWE